VLTNRPKGSSSHAKKLSGWIFLCFFFIWMLTESCTFDREAMAKAAGPRVQRYVERSADETIVTNRTVLLTTSLTVFKPRFKTVLFDLTRTDRLLPKWILQIFRSVTDTTLLCERDVATGASFIDYYAVLATSDACRRHRTTHSAGHRWLDRTSTACQSIHPFNQSIDDPFTQQYHFCGAASRWLMYYWYY